MINVRELTIGSLVADDLGTILEVTSLSPTIINAKMQGRHGSSGYVPSDLEPIPLTAEWLKRLGFKKDEEDEEDWHHPKLDCVVLGPGKSGMFYDDRYSYELTPARSVHELQRVVFHYSPYWLTLTPTTPTP